MKPTAQFLLLCTALCSYSTAHSIDSQQQPLVHAPDLAPLEDASRQDAPSYRESLLSLHRSLVEIPSISGTEQQAATYLASYLTSLGFRAELQALPESGDGSPRYNVLAFPDNNNNNNSTSRRGDDSTSDDLAGRVLVTSHIDVVPPYIPYRISDAGPEGITRATHISGRGSVDAKASVAAQVIAVRDLVSSGAVPADRVALLYVVGEEVGGDGMKHFSSVLGGRGRENEDEDGEETERRRIELKAAVFGEPTENKLACGHKGITSATLTARGRAGHSGYPWLGKSATEVLVRALHALLVEADLGGSERYGNTTVNVGVVRGGVAANVIAKEAHAELSIRVAAGNRTTGAALVQRRMREVVDRVDSEALSLECADGYGPVECDCEVDGFETMVANYGTDVPHLKGNHVSYLYGPGSILVAHGDDEGLRVGDLEDAVEGYKRLIVHAVNA